MKRNMVNTVIRGQYTRRVSVMCVAMFLLLGAPASSQATDEGEEASAAEYYTLEVPGKLGALADGVESVPPNGTNLKFYYVDGQTDEKDLGLMGSAGDQWIAETVFWESEHLSAPPHLEVLSSAGGSPKKELKVTNAVAPYLPGKAKNHDVWISERWAFHVTSASLPDGTVVSGQVSGKLVVDGLLWQHGSGSALAEGSLSVKHRLSPLLGGLSPSRIVAAKTLFSHELRHGYSYSVGLGLGVEVGDGGEVLIDLGAARSFSHQELRLDKQTYDFTVPLLLQVGQFYELDFTLTTRVTNRGLAAVHRSGVKIGYDPSTIIGSGRDGEGGFDYVPMDDPSHLLDAISFFQLSLPDLPIGKPLAGKASFKFPALSGLTSSKMITVNNDFDISPAGNFSKFSEIWDKLGVTPADIGTRMSVSVDPAGAPDQLLPPDPNFVGGAFFGRLEIELYED